MEDFLSQFSRLKKYNISSFSFNNQKFESK